MPSNGIERTPVTEYESLPWSVREIRIEANPAAYTSKPRPLLSSIDNLQNQSFGERGREAECSATGKGCRVADCQRAG